MLSHDAVIHNARVNFEIVIAKNYSPTVLAMELGVEKEIESLLTDPTVGDLYNRDPWTIMLPGPPAKPSKSSTSSQLLTQSETNGGVKAFNLAIPQKWGFETLQPLQSL